MAVCAAGGRLCCDCHVVESVCSATAAVSVCAGGKSEQPCEKQTTASAELFGSHLNGPGKTSPELFTQIHTNRPYKLWLKTDCRKAHKTAKHMGQKPQQPHKYKMLKKINKKIEK